MKMKKPPPEIEPPEQIGDARSAFMRVFEKIGGIEQMTIWARNHRANFYLMFAKLAPLMQTNIAVNNTVNVSQDPVSELYDAYVRRVQVRNEEIAQTGIIIIDGVEYRRAESVDATPTAPPPPLPPINKAPPPPAPELKVVASAETPKPAPPRPQEARERAMAPSVPPPPRDPNAPPSNTKLALDWMSNGGGGGSVCADAWSPNANPSWPRLP